MPALRERQQGAEIGRSYPLLEERDDAYATPTARRFASSTI